MTNSFTAQSDSIRQRLQIVPLLKCDINAKDKDGFTPLLQLMENSWSRLPQTFTKPFIENGADINIKDKDGNTALMLACKNNHITATLMLLNSKELINAQNNDGNTALHIAVKNGFETAYMLLNMGADYKIKNNNGETAEEIITEYDNDTLIRRLGKKRPDSPSNLSNLAHNAFASCGKDDNDKYEFAMYITKILLNEIDEDDDDELAYIIDILYSALSEGYINILDLIAESDIDFTMPIINYSKTTNIRDYCFNEFFGVETINKLIELGVDMNCAFVKGKTPANIVASLSKKESWFSREENHYHADAAKLFSCESMEVLNEEGISAVHYAAQNNHTEMLNVMLDKGVDININEDYPQESGITPLHIACTYENTETVKLLKSRGADDSLQTASGETAAHFVLKKIYYSRSVDEEKRAEIMELLDNVDIPRNDGKTPLILAQMSDWSMAEKITPVLLDKGADVNCADNDGNTALTVHADRHYSKNVIKELIRAGADINHQDSKGNTALHYILENGSCEIARFLIKKGADFNIANNKKETAMSIAVKKGYEDVLNLMI